jgi:HEAT repeat protein
MRFSSFCLAAGLLILGSALAVGAPEKPAKEDPKSDKESSIPKDVGGKTIEQWIKEIKEDPDPSVREAAIQAVVQFGPGARKAVPALITELQDRDASIRSHAAISLGAIGCDEKDLKRGVNALVRLLSDAQAVVRYQAAMSLGHLGPDASEATSYLATYTIKDLSSWPIRKAAAYALGSVAGKEKDDPDVKAINGLVYAMTNDSSAHVRLEAVMSLILLGPPKSDSSKEAAEAVLKRLTRDKNHVVAIWAHVGLMRWDKVTKTHVLAIAEMLTHSDQMTRMHALRALGTLGTEAKDAVSFLQKAAKAKDPATRQVALMALTTIADPKTAVQDLTDSLQDKEPSVRVTAAQSLGKLGKSSRKAVPSLIEMVQKDKEPFVVGAAIWALGEIGPGAEDALPALQKIAKEEEEPLQKAANEAIDKIQGKKPKAPKKS